VLRRVRSGPSLHREGRLVFVVGSPRSGTTFLGNSLGAQPGLVDLGEVKPLKSAIPQLATLPEGEAAARVRRTLQVVRTLGVASHLRGVEQTPETSFVLEAALRAYPSAQAVHIVRDGRDVCARSSSAVGLARTAKAPTTQVWHSAPTRASGSSPSVQTSSRRPAKRGEPRGRGAAMSPPQEASPNERSSSATSSS
jgi:hypothetical protein